MKDRIIERLLSEGHISVRIVDIILNNKEGKVTHIANLKDDSITNWEAITLLKDNETQPMPLTYPPNYYDWTWDPNRPGTPRWDVTCTKFYLNKIKEYER